MSANIAVNSAITSPVVIETLTGEPRQKKPRRPKPTHMCGEAPIVPGDFLGLPGLRTTAPPEVGDFSILVRAEQERPNSCPYCECADRRFRPNGTRSKKPQELLDEPRGFRRVRIELTRRNFRCGDCGASGLLPLWGVREGQRATDRLIRHVEHASLFRPFAEVALATGLSPRKVKEVFDGYVGRLGEAVSFEPPRVIGIDGIKIRKKGYFTVITDIERRLVLHMWGYSRNEKKAEICNAAPLRKPFSRLERHERKYLVEWLRRDPVLRAVYKKKEEFRQMWPSASGAEAKRFYQEWLLPFAVKAPDTEEDKLVRKDFAELHSAMGNWGEYIFNYFDFDRKPTNAFTEWANRSIRAVLRESRGCGVDVIRGKLIFGTWMRRRMKEGADRWGESTVVMARTRRRSEPKPKKNPGARKPKKPSVTYRIPPTQPSLLES